MNALLGCFAWRDRTSQQTQTCLYVVSDALAWCFFNLDRLIRLHLKPASRAAALLSFLWHKTLFLWQRLRGCAVGPISWGWSRNVCLTFHRYIYYRWSMSCKYVRLIYGSSLQFCTGLIHGSVPHGNSFSAVIVVWIEARHGSALHCLLLLLRSCPQPIYPYVRLSVQGSVDTKSILTVISDSGNKGPKVASRDVVHCLSNSCAHDRFSNSITGSHTFSFMSICFVVNCGMQNTQQLNEASYIIFLDASFPQGV